MMIASAQFVGQVTAFVLGRKDDPVLGQEFKRAVNGGLGHAGLPDVLVDLGRGEMPFVVQGFENGQPLGGHAESALAQGLGMDGEAGHFDFLIAKIINNNYMQ
jgi:hypothetical protein